MSPAQREAPPSDVKTVFTQHLTCKKIDGMVAAINRGVLATYTDWDDADKFFTRADGIYNHYARIMHASAIDNKVYSFGYDDIYGQDPTLSDALDDVDQMILAIPAFDRP